MKNHLRKHLVLLIHGALILSVVCCVSANAASFDIKPVRLEMSKETPLDKLVIKNISEADFPIQVRVYEWHQNEKGEDVYTETKDIITFPKILTIKSGEERYIRVGSNVVPGNTEKTYRIYVEEMPSGPVEHKGTNIRLYLKVGIPVFIRPPDPKSQIIVNDISMDNGTMQVKVKNGGNAHFIVTGIRIQGFNDEGTASFDRNIGGWYHLSGIEKAYTTQVPSELCDTIRNFSIEVNTKETTLTKQFQATGSMCGELAETAEKR